MDPTQFPGSFLLIYRQMKHPDQEKEVISVVELDQFKTTLNAYKHPLQEVRIHFDLANKEQRIQELERKMEEPDF